MTATIMLKPEIANLDGMLRALQPGQSVGVVTLSGALSPVHVMHVEILRGACELVRDRHAAAIAFLAPSSEGYVNDKLGADALQLELRNRCCQAVAQDSTWLGVCPWGRANSGSVCDATVAYLRASFPDLSFQGYEVAGADYALKARLWRKASAKRGAVAFRRKGDTAQLEAEVSGQVPNPFFVLGPELEDVSSTVVRQHLRSAGSAESREALAALLPPEVLALLLSESRPFRRAAASRQCCGM